MNEERPVLHWLRRKWRALRSARRAAQEQNPGGLLRLAGEVRTLAEAARRVCPPEQRLQSRIRAVHEEMDRLVLLAQAPEFRCLDSGKRQQLRKGLVQSREQLLRVMGQVSSPTRLLQ
ncbi:MAG: hypothetical protein Q8O35_10880 [Humidesulfovibrio sp.]|uniref:hypothetical protein n=1 Tax=Humidesulfovibrio sp. TaxID=2910988 RepID=UPI0027343C8A|nr:hypothetical protein [Humidesulfovibrio sp.]MDP2848678.1 hypothetical protein [Humidesulfovibrio sp.]